MMKNVQYYMSLNYDYKLREIVEEDGEKYYRVSIPQLPGVIAYGDSINEAYEEILGAKKVWFEKCLEDGVDIPEPTTDMYSGRITIRIPKSLHEELAISSKSENVSLNQYIVTLLSRNSIVSTYDEANKPFLKRILEALIQPKYDVIDNNNYKYRVDVSHSSEDQHTNKIISPNGNTVTMRGLIISGN